MTAQPTHVLSWLPPYLIVGGGRDGWWDLQTLASYDAGEPVRDAAWSYDAPRNAAPAGLAPWVSERVGFPVTLTAGEVEIRRSLLGRRHLEPVYYVTPATVTR